MTQLVLRDARIIDAISAAVSEPTDILIEDGHFAAIGSDAGANDIEAIDLAGRYVMPGLIDCHAHPFLADTNLSRLNLVPPTLMAARAGKIMECMLMRGFTTIRDAAGGDWGIKQAVEDGLIAGPRMFIAGRALTQTGGHGDMRPRTDDIEICGCGHALAYTGRIADGIDEIRKAVRDELRKGADQIKIMVSGGVSSPHDPLECNQFSEEEIRTVVEEAERRNTYVMAHAYGADAIRVALECGVRTIEHGNLIDEDAANLAGEKGAYLVPTLVTYEVLADTAGESGWSEDMLAKLDRVRFAGLNAIKLCRKAGVKIGFGTDLLGDSFDHQLREFEIRSQIDSAAQVIASATAVNAEILQMQGKLGVISEGAMADLLVLDGNPMDDIGLLSGQGDHLRIVMKDGKIFKNTLSG
ncbi:MAG: amidohydrolase family protein [Erythrobacter sp.]